MWKILMVLTAVMIIEACNAPRIEEKTPDTQIIEPRIITEPDVIVGVVETEQPDTNDILEGIDLLSILTMAEAEGESDEGKRLVIDVVLNRVDSEYFPNTIKEVIYQSYQFTSMWNGRADRCYVQEPIRKLVLEELASRTNSDVMFFTAGGYGQYGRPMFQVGNHYFCSYE